MSQLTCGQCGSHYVFRSHRRGLEYLMFWVRPYRCHDCKHRFFAKKMPHSVHDAARESRKRMREEDKAIFEPQSGARPYSIRKV